MKFFYHSILLFIYFSALFINPHASPSSHARSTLLMNASLVSQETCKKVLDNTRRSLEQGTPDFCKASGAPILIGSTGPDDIKIPKTPNGKVNFKLIMDAIKAAPSHSNNHFVILVKKGVYKEYVNIDQTKTNIVLMGEGKDATIISGSKSVGGGQQTFDSATFAVSAQGFVAIDIGFENTAGQKNMQAVAVLSAGDHAAFQRCKITGNQDTLLVHAGRQFFRECEIIGTVDFIFGYGTAVFQKCNIYIRKNEIGGTSVISAHGRNSSTEASGFSFHDCAINDKLYFGEFQNSGPGAAVGVRVKWPGFHQMTAADADKFTVAKFIDGNSWLPALGIPFSPGVNPSADPPKWELEYSSHDTFTRLV
ncbi:hypothetical protein ACLB2K_065759 [Fragaria x ananassa]